MIALVLSVYLILMLVVGIWANKFNKNATDFLLAGRRLGLWLTVFALVATYVGGGVVMGYAESAYRSGLVIWWNGIGSGIGFVLLGFMAFKLRDLALYTLPDFLLKRYESPTIRLMAAVFSLLALIGILGGNVGAASGILEMLGVGSGVEVALIVCAVFIIYTGIGGLWAATMTDFIQIIIAAVGVVGIFVVKLNTHGGWGEISSKIMEIDPSGAMLSLFGTGDVSMIMWLALPIMLYTLIGQDVYQRLFATKSPAVARAACFISGIIFVAFALIPVLLGLIGRIEYPGAENPAQVLPAMVTESLSPLFAGVVLAAIMAAIMSTAASLLTASASHVINDIYVGAINKGDASKVSEKSMLAYSRLTTVVVGILAVILSTLVPKILELMLYSYTLYTSGVFIPVVGGYVWKKATKQGALAAMIFGFSIAILSFAGITFFGIPTDIFSAMVSIFVFVSVSLLTQPKVEA